MASSNGAAPISQHLRGLPTMITLCLRPVPNWTGAPLGPSLTGPPLAQTRAKSCWAPVGSNPCQVLLGPRWLRPVPSWSGPLAAGGWLWSEASEEKASKLSPSRATPICHPWPRRAAVAWGRSHREPGAMAPTLPVNSVRIFRRKYAAARFRSSATGPAMAFASTSQGGNQSLANTRGGPSGTRVSAVDHQSKSKQTAKEAP